MTDGTGRHIAVIGAGIVGVVSAIEPMRDGHRVTLVEPGAPGDTQAASYGNAGWLGSRSVIPPATSSTPCHAHVGLAGSARTGRLVAQLISGRITEIRIAAFEPRRFC